MSAWVPARLPKCALLECACTSARKGSCYPPAFLVLHALMRRCLDCPRRHARRYLADPLADCPGSVLDHHCGCDVLCIIPRYVMHLHSSDCELVLLQSIYQLNRICHRGVTRYRWSIVHDMKPINVDDNNSYMHLSLVSPT